MSVQRALRGAGALGRFIDRRAILTMRHGGRWCSAAASSSASQSVRGDFVRLLRLARPFAFRLGCGCGVLAVSSSITLSVPYLLGNVMDLSLGTETGVAGMLHKLKAAKRPPSTEAEEEEEQPSTAGAGPNITERLSDVAYLMLGLFVVGSAAAFLRLYLMQTAGQMVTNRLRTDAFGAMLRQEIAYFDKNKTGELVNRLSNDATIVGHSVSMNVSNGLRGVLAMCGSAGMMLFTSPQLSMVGLSLSPLVAVVAIVYGRYLKKLTVMTNDRLAEAAQVAEERLSAIRTVRAFGAERKEHGRYERRIDRVLQVVFKECTARAGFFSTASLAGNMMILAILYGGGNMIVTGTLTVGQLTSFLVYAIYLFVSMEAVTNFYTEIVRGAAAGKRLFDIVDRTPLIPVVGGKWPAAFNGDVTLSNVTYNFGTLAVLRDFSLRLPPGKVTALVGASGSGKSTVASLILRYYDPNSGSILLGDNDLKSLDPQWIRQNVAVVSQEPTLFSDTIAANIAYGAKDPDNVSIDQIRAVAKTAYADHFIDDMPDKFDTVLGERGQTLSGGQRQRIAIARALLCEPKLLILDEATSALDGHSERFVTAALDQLLTSGKHTVLVIAHRLSSVRNAAQIAVLHGGAVVELGTYEHLMGIPDGVFANLVSRQTFAG